MRPVRGTSRTTSNRDFPGGPLIKTLHFQCRDMGLIPGPGKKIPHTMCCVVKKKKKKKTNIEHINIHVIGVPDDVFDEIIVKNFQNLKKETDVQIQEAEWLSNKMNPNRPIPRHIII